MTITTNENVRRYSDELEIKDAPDGTDRFRYRCGFCGHRGRWLKNGSMANVGLRAHQGDSMERTPCPRLR